MSEEKSRYDVKLPLFGIPRVLPYLKEHKRTFIWMIVTTLLASVIDSVYPLFNQYALNHFHWYKMEDIINRGGGNILIRVYNSLPDESIDKEGDVTVHVDGETRVVPAGTQIRLEPGMSLTIMQGMYHDFEVEPGTGAVLIGEVSQCNDDNTDNRFNPPAGRFPEIEEDEPPYRLLCNEYPAAPEE